MIIRRITIANWRGLEHFEAELDAGLNIVCGPNEAGKSSVVEALSWALQRDLVGGPRVREEILGIIPANNPKAKPRVELSLEFPDCSATIQKTLAEDSAARECCLTIRRDGVADQTCDREAAQAALRRLMAGDGATHNRSSPSQNSQNGGSVDASLLVSAQGQSTFFVGQELSNAARSSIALGEDGALAATSRLEKARVALNKKRREELFEKLKPNAIDAAKKATEAARARDELSALREEHAEYSNVEAQIGSLREEIKNLLARYAEVAPRAEELRAQWQNEREMQSAQIVAEREVAEKRRAHDEYRTLRDTLARRVEEISGLRAQSTRAGIEVQQLQGQLNAARQSEADWKEKTDHAWRAHEAAENLWIGAREKLQAWDRYVEVCAASRERKARREVFEAHQKQAGELEAQRKVLEELGRVPPRAQVNRWRTQYSQIENARLAASQTLKITLQIESEIALKFRADGGIVETLELGAGEERVLGAQAQAALRIAGVGKIFVGSGSREAQKQIGEIEAKTRDLEKGLAVFGVALDALPDAFESLEERCAAHESASQQLNWMQQQANHSSDESLDELQQRWQNAEAEYSRARAACEPFRDAIPEGVKTSQANIERERARENERKFQEDAERARRAWQKTLAGHSEYSNAASAFDARLQALETNRAQGAARLLELEADGLHDSIRAQQLDDLNEKLWQAKGARDEAINIREAMGAVVTDETILLLEREAKALQDEQFALEKEVAGKRATLKMHCEQDPQTEMERLRFEIEAREIEVARFEARLRGVAILESALEAERHRLGRAIAAPLNEYLSPWLSELRGKTTRVEFDENTGRILGVQTQNETAAQNGANGNGKVRASTHVLPFGSHSGGMQEQTALALRLILAQAAAKKLPGKKLPLVLDDPLTQSDTTRRAGLWRVLHQASEFLQIVFVTCHETHLPPREEAHFITLGDWCETKKTVQPIVIEKSAGQKMRAKRGKKTKSETHDVAAQKTEAESLALW